MSVIFNPSSASSICSTHKLPSTYIGVKGGGTTLGNALSLGRRENKTCSFVEVTKNNGDGDSGGGVADSEPSVLNKRQLKCQKKLDKKNKTNPNHDPDRFAEMMKIARAKRAAEGQGALEILRARRRQDQGIFGDDASLSKGGAGGDASDSDEEEESNRTPPLIVAGSARSYAIDAGVLESTASSPELIVSSQSSSASDHPKVTAIVLKAFQTMFSTATLLRSQDEGVRSLPYFVDPLEWDFVSVDSSTAEGERVAELLVKPSQDGAETISHGPAPIKVAPTSSASSQPPYTHLSLPLRPIFSSTSSSQKRRSHSVVFQTLINPSKTPSDRQGFHISCGGKFGADLLLYDGDRERVHAFAGLRVYRLSKTLTDKALEDDEGGLALIMKQLPNCYDLTGYVRGLNTASKIALIAIFVEGSSSTTGASGTSGEGDCIVWIRLWLKKIETNETHIKNAKRKAVRERQAANKAARTAREEEGGREK